MLHFVSIFKIVPMAFGCRFGAQFLLYIVTSSKVDPKSKGTSQISVKQGEELMSCFYFQERHRCNWKENLAFNDNPTVLVVILWKTT